jgi:hypothetical protein
MSSSGPSQPRWASCLTQCSHRCTWLRSWSKQNTMLLDRVCRYATVPRSVHTYEAQLSQALCITRMVAHSMHALTRRYCLCLCCPVALLPFGSARCTRWTRWCPTRSRQMRDAMMASPLACRVQPYVHVRLPYHGLRACGHRPLLRAGSRSIDPGGQYCTVPSQA